MTTEVFIAVIVAGVLLVLLGGAELGYQLARRAPGSRTEEASQIGNWEGALLGLLALLIGFTFAMAVSRFDGRRELIVDEANAIQQLARRAEYLAPPVQERMTGLLRSYVDARIRSYDAGMDLSRTEAAYREAFALQRQLWAQAAEVARNNLNSEMASLFVESADAVLEMGARRRAALDNHVPPSVMILLLLGGRHRHGGDGLCLRAAPAPPPVRDGRAADPRLPPSCCWWWIWTIRARGWCRRGRGPCSGCTRA